MELGKKLGVRMMGVVIMWPGDWDEDGFRGESGVRVKGVVTRLV